MGLPGNTGDFGITIGDFKVETENGLGPLKRAPLKAFAPVTAGP